MMSVRPGESVGNTIDTHSPPFLLPLAAEDEFARGAEGNGLQLAQAL
jgi:hypothetical protein